MPDIKVYNNSSWVEPSQIHAYQNGWQPVKGLWIYNNGWTKLYPASGTQQFTAAGSGTFTVPNGIYTLTISYPTTSAIVNTTLAVTPGQSISYTVGNYGEAGSFGSITIPAFSTTTIGGAYVGVDSTWHATFSVATPTAISVGFNGGAGANYNTVSAAGGYWQESNIGNHGDLGASGTLYTVPNSVMVGPCRLNPSGTGPFGVGVPYYDSNLNMWIGDLEVDDPANDQHPHNYSLNMTMLVPISIAW